jgi:hypothetical protein
MCRLCARYVQYIMHLFCTFSPVGQNNSIKPEDGLIGAETCSCDKVSNNKVATYGCLCIEDFINR